MNVKNLRASTGIQNTGKIANPLDPDLVISGMLVPYTWTQTVAIGESSTTTLANLETALTGLLLNDDPLQRGFYIGPFDAFNDKSEATTYQTLGYGKKVETQRQIITKEYQIIEGGVEYWKSVQSFKGRIGQYKWIEFDNSGVVYATNTYDATLQTVTGYQGFRLSDLTPQDRKQANKGAVEEHIISLTFQNSGEANEDLYTLETGIEIDELISGLGIQDVNITATGPMVAKVTTFSITAGFGGINLCVSLPLLIVAASFTLTNEETASTAITVTSWAIVNSNAVLTLSGAGAGWVPGNHMLVKLKAVSVLSAAGFKYYESNTASVVMVA